MIICDRCANKADPPMKVLINLSENYDLCEKCTEKLRTFFRTARVIKSRVIEGRGVNTANNDDTQEGVQLEEIAAPPLVKEKERDIVGDRIRATEGSRVPKIKTYKKIHGGRVR